MSNAVVHKKKGRPATGQDPVTAIRLAPDLLTRIDTWAAAHEMRRSEAIRALIEAALGDK